MAFGSGGKRGCEWKEVSEIDKNTVRCVMHSVECVGF